jgi:hypothetical protein
VIVESADLVFILAELWCNECRHLTISHYTVFGGNNYLLDYCLKCAYDIQL